MRSAKWPWILGSVTAALGAWTLVGAGSFLRSGGQDSPEAHARRRRSYLGRAIGARVRVTGASKVLAARGRPRRAQRGSRTAHDLGADVRFGTVLPAQAQPNGSGCACTSAFADTARGMTGGTADRRR